jgi:hypothetical protein
VRHHARARALRGALRLSSSDTVGRREDEEKDELYVYYDEKKMFS